MAGIGNTDASFALVLVRQLGLNASLVTSLSHIRVTKLRYGNEIAFLNWPLQRNVII